MDTTKLQQDLANALAQVVTDEATLQSAVQAVNGVLQPSVDPTWVAVKAALEANGWTAPASE